MSTKYLRDFKWLVRPAICPMEAKLVPEEIVRADEASHSPMNGKKVPERQARADEPGHIFLGWQVSTGGIR